MDSLLGEGEEVGPALRDGRRRFELLEEIGSDGCGDWLIAEDRQRSSPDCLALCTAHLPSVRPDHELSDGEATVAWSEIVARCDAAHAPAALPLYEAHASPPLICFERRGGVPATSLINAAIERGEGAFDDRSAARLGAQAADVIAALHSAGVANVGSVAERSSISGDQLLMPAWAEQPLASTGERRDSGMLWDIAEVATFFELLTGQECEDVLDPSLRRIVRRAHGYGGSTYRSADMLAHDLRCWADRLPVEWQRPSVWRRARLTTHRRPMLSAMVVVTVLAAIATIVSLVAVAKSQAALLEQERATQRNIADIEMMLSMMRSDDYTQSLEQSYLLEWLAEGPALTDTDASMLVRADRIVRLREMVEGDAATGDRGAAALFRESTLVRMVAQHGDPADAAWALPIAERNHASMRKLYGDDDEWVQSIAEAMESMQQAEHTGEGQ